MVISCGLRAKMQLRRVAAGIASLALVAAGQTAQRTRSIGTITEISASGATLKTDAGAPVALVFAPETRFQRVAPGEKDLSKAQTITVADLASGDRVLARGTASADGKTLTAQSVIVMSAGDIARKNENERAEWMHRGMAGLVTSVDAARNEIQIRIPGLLGQVHTGTVVLKDSTRFRRYAPDSVRFADARPGTLADLKEGDQLRVLGDKSEDGTRITADEVVSGSFRTVAGAVTAVNAAANEVDIKDLQSGQLLTVKITPDSQLRRLPEFPMMGRTGSGPGASGPPAGGGFGGGRPPDMQQMLERLPPVSLGEIKPGETIIVSSTRGASPDRLTAVTLLAGADALIAMRQAVAARTHGQNAPAGQPMGTWNLGDMSMIPMP